MGETDTLVAEKTEEVVTATNPFSENGWKPQPTATSDEVKTETVVEVKEEKHVVEKVEEIKVEEKPVVVAPEPIKFANEESEKIHNLLLAGEGDKALEIYAENKKLSSVEGADAIKLQLQYQNKDFSKDDINELFNERYEMPEKPVQDLETDEEFSAKIEKYEKEVKRVENRIIRDAKPAKTELLKLQKEIVLPDIKKPEAQVNEPSQEELDAQKQRAEKFSQSVDDGLQKWEGYNATFKDEEVEIKVAYTPTAEEKKELQPIISLAGTNAGEFMQKIGWVDDKGNINTAKLAEDLPLILSKEKVLNKLVSETGNKRHEASIKSIKNIDYSGGQSNGNLGATNQEKEGAMVNHFFSQ